MLVILLNKVENLGSIGDRVKVKAGYARNFLFPKGKAVSATKKNIEYFESRRVDIEKKLNEALEFARIRAEKINTLHPITITAKVGLEGKLFGSIGSRNISEAITAAGVQVAKHEVRLPNGVLRTVGEHKVNLQLHSEVLINVIINIIPQ